MQLKNVISLTFISTLISTLMIFLVIPFITSELAPYIHALELTDANLLVGYVGLLVIIATMELSFMLFARKDFRMLSVSIIYSFLFSVLFLCLISFFYVGIFRSDRLYGMSTLKIFLHFFVYPTIVAIDFGTIEIFWEITIILFVILFIVKYIQFEKSSPVQRESEIYQTKSVKLDIKKRIIYEVILGLEIVIPAIIGVIAYLQSLKTLYFFLVQAIMVLGFTSLFHFTIGKMINKLRNSNEESILEHSIFSSLAIFLAIVIDYFFIHSSLNFIVLFQLEDNSIYIWYWILSMILTIAIFYFISAISFIILKKHRLSIDIMSLIVGYSVCYLLFILDLFSLMVILSIIFIGIMIVLILTKKIY